MKQIIVVDENKAELVKAFQKIRAHPYNEPAAFEWQTANAGLPIFWQNICREIAQDRKNNREELHYIVNLPVTEQLYIPSGASYSPVDLKKELRNAAFEPEKVIQSSAAIMDAPILAYQTRGEGARFQHVYPQPGYSNTISALSDTDIPWHNDRTPHPVRPDNIIFLGVNVPEESEVLTLFKTGASIQKEIGEEHHAILEQAYFVTEYILDAGNEKERTVSSGPHAIFEKDGETRYIGPATGVRSTQVLKGLTPNETRLAQTALEAFEDGIKRSQTQGVRIERGAMLAAPNLTSLHNRKIVNAASEMNRRLMKAYTFANQERARRHEGFFADERFGLIDEAKIQQAFPGAVFA
ncbi:MAG: hypothetical protein R3E13_01360 [Alphaproteobacteria bacterium]